VKAQAAGKSYDNLADRLAGVRARLQELDAAGGGQESVAKGAESVAKAVEAEGKSLGDLSKDLKDASMAAKGLGQIKQALAMIMSGNVVGALRAVTAGWRAMTLAMASNPLGAILAVTGLLITALIKIRNHFKEVADGVDNLNKANLADLQKSADAAGDAAKKLAGENFDALKSQFDALLAQQREYQQELDHSYEKQLKLIDADLADKIARLNMEKQTALAAAENPEQRERIQLEYRGKELVARQQAGQGKAAAAVSKAESNVTLARKGVQIAQDNRTTLNANVGAAESGAAAALAAIPAGLSDQQLRLDRLEQLRCAGEGWYLKTDPLTGKNTRTFNRRTTEQELEFRQLSEGAAGDAADLAGGQVTFKEELARLAAVQKSGQLSDAGVERLEAIKQYMEAAAKLGEAQKNRDPAKLNEEVDLAIKKLRAANDALEFSRRDAVRLTSTHSAETSEQNNSVSQFEQKIKTEQAKKAAADAAARRQTERQELKQQLELEKDPARQAELRAKIRDLAFADYDASDHSPVEIAEQKKQYDSQQQHDQQRKAIGQQQKERSQLLDSAGKLGDRGISGGVIQTVIDRARSEAGPGGSEITDGELSQQLLPALTQAFAQANAAHDERTARLVRSIIDGVEKSLQKSISLANSQSANNRP
jgi:hypothetical protein